MTSKFVAEVEAIYNSTEGDVWEFIMGRHIHTGGIHSSQYLASKAHIMPYMTGIDLCCNNGESCRYLVRNRGVRKMHGVDLSATGVSRGRARSKEEGFAPDQIEFTKADITKGLPMFESNSFDFVWGEDAWCYIPDKAALVATAFRLLKPGGVIAFTDWIAGSKPMTKEESEKYVTLMTFPADTFTKENYVEAMMMNGFNVELAEHSNRFVPCTQLYIDMLEMQLKGDALRVCHFDVEEYEKTMKDLYFLLDLAKNDKLTQGVFIGRKKGGKSMSKL
eukprot:UN01916